MYFFGRPPPLQDFGQLYCLDHLPHFQILVTLLGFKFASHDQLIHQLVCLLRFWRTFPQRAEENGPPANTEHQDGPVL